MSSLFALSFLGIPYKSKYSAHEFILAKRPARNIRYDIGKGTERDDLVLSQLALNQNEGVLWVVLEPANDLVRFSTYKGKPVDVLGLEY
jgi:hypothetical protein